ncbi:MAG: multidrug efflux RND transporter permease subunit [Candidatus Auribacterota bacterium]|jgi:HAE1 family hydrophobic/amphiphilic exporter-1|nr:multidrug efflux RND transporter permease subunit [Candidatus Auribacterota bacterium]
MLSTFFINRPIFATVISIFIVLIGLLAIPMLPVEKTPDITPPTIVVEASYPGASAEVIAETVTQPIEEEINGVEGMIYMSSKSSDNGTASITVTFEVGTDIDMATVLVQNRVAKAEAVLPEDVKRYGITIRKQTTNIALMVNLMSPDNRYDQAYLSNYINIYLKDKLMRVPGVSSITVFGGKDFSMRVWLDPNLLKARKLTTVDVLNAIREQNIQVAAGKIGAPPTPDTQLFQYTIRTLGRLSDAEEFKDIIIKTTEDNRIVRLKDVATIELGAEDYSAEAQCNGQPSIMMGIFQLPSANSLEVAANVRKAMDELSKNFPEGLSYGVPFDPTLYIDESIKEVVFTLFIAVLLVILTVYIFLGDLRTTLIPSLTIPVSLIGTLFVMKITGMSINTLSLFGLVLVIGIVVDDAIVVVENVMRIMDDEGLSPKEASIKAMKQITGPVIATTLVLLAVFVPTMFVGGISGRLYTQFAMSIATATVFSSINALTLSPALCAILLRPTSSLKANWYFRLFNIFMKKTTNGYMWIVNRILRRSILTMLLFAGICVLSLHGFRTLPTGFLPDEDEGIIFLSVELPDGASLERTKKVTARINEMLKETEGIGNFVTVNGFSILNSLMSTNSATFFVSLKPWSYRKTPELSSTNMTRSLQMRLFGIREAFCLAFTPPPIMGLGFASGFELQIQDRGNAGYTQLYQIGQKIVFDGNSDPVLTRLNSSFRANIPQLYVDIDRTKIKTLSLSLKSVFDTLQSYLGTNYVNDFNVFGKNYKVIMQADSKYRMKESDIETLEVRNSAGKMVPFKSFAAVRHTTGPQSITRYNMYPSNTITGVAKPGYSSGDAITAMEKLLKKTLPSSMGYEWSGLSYQQIEAGGKASLIFLLAAFFAFLFLAAQYESWAAPFAIILSVPLALLGAVSFTLARAFENNIYMQIGIVLLIGLATKTSILLVEFAKQHHEEGYSIWESAKEAARLRFRPILMTALSTLLGTVPLVIATGAGANSRKALGTAVFGGMLFATVFGVLFIPVFYFVVQKAADKIKSRFGKKKDATVDTVKQ